MAESSRTIDYWRAPNPTFSWFIAFASLAIGSLPFIFALIALAIQTDAPVISFLSISPALIDAAIFTLQQAFISASFVGLLAPLFGIGLVFLPLSIRKTSTILRTLLFCLPSIVIATGIILAWGQKGLGTQALSSLGVNIPVSDLVYSPYALCLANVMMNLPFAALMIFRRLCAISPDQINAAKQLGLTLALKWSHLIWPAIRSSLIYFAGMTFILSMGSFGALSILGGGPGSQTLELGIYQSIYFDANWGAGASYAIAHTLFAGITALGFLIPQYIWLKSAMIPTSASDATIEQVKSLLSPNRVFKSILIISAFSLDLFIIVPILALFIDAFRIFNVGHHGNSWLNPALIRGLSQSLAYAAPSGVMATLSAWIVARSFCRYTESGEQKKSIILLSSTLTMTIIPSMSTAFGIVVIRSFYPDFINGTLAIIALHTAMALPLLVTLSIPSYALSVLPFQKLKEIEGFSMMTWTTKIEFRLMAKTLTIMTSIALALSLNETAIVSMLGDPESPALTTTMIRLMGHYRFGDSALASCLLIIVTSFTVWLSHDFRSVPNEKN